MQSAFMAPSPMLRASQGGNSAVSRRPPPVSCATPQPPKRKAGQSVAPAAADGATTLGTTSGTSRINAGLMQAMGDYFGDDGRELDDYAKRPRNAARKVMLRVLLVGSGAGEVAAARALRESKRVRGLYYCPDDAGTRSEEMEALATCSTVGATGMEAEIVHFCSWAFVDCVFVGPDRAGSIGQATEAALAAEGITLFQHDVSAAIAAGAMTVDECFASISEELDAVAPPADQLVE
jgi:hypothetical protein